MNIAVCGSLAFDTLFEYPGQFKDQILADRLDALSVSFFVPTMRREFGGCAGNMAYNLHQLGESACVVAALGVDGQEYAARLTSWGCPSESIALRSDAHTAQAMIMTDERGNQITAFHPGAMNFAHEIAIPALANLQIGIVSPDGKLAMQTHAAQFSELGVPWVFDPGQGLPMFNGDELMAFIDKATWLSVNDYEADLLSQRTGLGLNDLAARVKGMVVTRGELGCDVFEHGQCKRIPGHVPQALVDPTGCGDAFRAGLLYGLVRGWSMHKACALGNVIGSVKIAHRGGQNHRLELSTLMESVNAQA
jgi:adenosine kinase